MSSIYDSARLAAAYAYSRPPVHRQIIEAARRRLDATGVPRAGRALDIGCGAGVSTAALEPLADVLVGIEPVKAMLRHRRDVAPRAAFLAGRAEALPFADRSFDLVAAAGSLNYTDLDVVLPGIARVLSTRGVLLVYDFSSGRRLAGDDRLDEWFAWFEEKYPFPPGYEMDVRRADLASAGLRLDGYEELLVEVPMTREAYLDYVLSETNVERAILNGEAEGDIAAWCAGGLSDIFEAGDARGVLFDAYVAYVHRAAV